MRLRTSTIRLKPALSDLPIPQLRLEQITLKSPLAALPLLNQISANVWRGDKIVLVGASGSGKTTLLRLINRLNTPTSGSIYFENQPYSIIPPIQLRQKITLVSSETTLLGMTVEEAIAYPLKLRNFKESEIQQRCETWIDHLKIPKALLSRSDLQLSQGEKQLIAIARAFVIQPSILLLDEPITHLDQQQLTQVLQALNLLSNYQTTVIIATHNLAFAQQYCQRVLHLQQGQLMTDAPVQQINWEQLQTSFKMLEIENKQEWE